MRSLVVEAWAGTWSRPVASSASAAVIALVCLVALATTGRTAATEQQVLATVDSLGTRLITVTDSTGSAGIGAEVVDVVREVDGVDRVLALGPAVDATMPGLAGTRTGRPVPARAVAGELPAEITWTAGRPPRPGEAVAGARAAVELGLDRGTGTAEVAGRAVAVVGTLTATDGPLSELDDALLLHAEEPGSFAVRYVHVTARTGFDVEAVAGVVTAVVPSAVPSAVDVAVAQGALDLRAVLSGTLGAASRQLMGVVLVVGQLLVGVTTTAAVLGRRRDLGRQRALGASRSTLVVLVVLHSTLAGVVGAVVGCAVGALFVRLAVGVWPPGGFLVGLVMLSLVVSLTGAVLPATAAARRDPVRILRVP